MKLVLEPADLLALFGGGEATEEVRARIAGMLLSTVDSPEMKEAINSRITEPTKQYLDRLINESIRETTTGMPPTHKLVGWGAQLVREAFQEDLRRSGTNLDFLIRKIVDEKFKAILTEELDRVVREQVRTLLKDEMLEEYASKIERIDVGKLIRDELNKRLMKLGAAT